LIGCSEVVWRQDTETVIRCLENAFRAFGGVPATIVPDNLKAAVIEADCDGIHFSSHPKS